MHGYWIIYNEQGTPQQKGSYFQGEPDGKWEFFDEKEQLTEVHYYEKGKPVGLWEYYKNGKLKKTKKQ